MTVQQTSTAQLCVRNRIPLVRCFASPRNDKGLIISSEAIRDSVIPEWSEGPYLICAIAHRGISRFRHSGMVQRTISGISSFRVRCFAPPRNDEPFALLCTPDSSHIRCHGEQSRSSEKARQDPEIQGAKLQDAKLQGVEARRAADRAGAGGTA